MTMTKGSIRVTVTVRVTVVQLQADCCSIYRVVGTRVLQLHGSCYMDGCTKSQNSQACDGLHCEA